MNRKTVVSSVLVVLFLVSVFRTNIFSGAADSHGSPGFHGSQSTVDWWPMFHHALNHTGYSTSTRAPNTNQVLWNYATRGWVASSPAVADGVVYVGSGDWNVYALNASTSARIWSIKTIAPVYSSPAVADGKVYVGSGDIYPYYRGGILGTWWIGGIYCLDASSGNVIWSHITSFPVESSPAVADGMVFVGACDNNVYAWDASTGAFIWSTLTGGWVISSPAVVDGMVFVGSNDTNVYALNEFTGSVVWNSPTGGYVDSSPAVANGMVFIGSCNNNVYALNEFTGAPIWTFVTFNWVESSPAVVGGVVFVGSNDTNVYALNAVTGAKIWNYPTVGPVISSPGVADGKVYVGSWNGRGEFAPAPFYCLNASSGAFIWSYETNSATFDSSPAIVGGVVYVGADDPDDNVYAFESNTTILAYCMTEAAYVKVSIALDGSPTGYTTPHTFTSLSAHALGTHTITVPNTDPSGQPFKNWNTGETASTITVSYAGFTYIAYYGASLPPTDVNTFHEGNGGGFPRDADPAICYDTVSGELLWNTMQGLLSWNGEQYYDFVPTLATNIPTRQNTTMVVTNTSTVNANPTGSTWTDGASTFSCVGWVDEKQNGFDNGDIVYMTDGTHWSTWTADTVTKASTVTVSLWRGSYVFNIRTADSHGKPIKFYGSDGNAVDTFDVMDAAYSFRWAEVLDVPGQPIWMFDKPFFDQLDHTYWTRVTAMDLAHLINDAIVPDTASNTLTLNVGCRFPDNAFKQILSNTWGDILSEEHSITLGGWDGNLFTTAKYGGPFPDWWIDWAGEGAGIDYVNLDPLNKVEAATYAGTGSYHVALVDRANNKVVLQKNPGFWQGWPAAGCNGSIDTVEIDYIADWTTRKNQFLAGTIDTCTVPRVNMFELLDATGQPANPQTKTIKNISPSSPSYDAFLFEFNISDKSPYVGTGQFPDGIPLNFFNNTHVRKAFAYSFNWSTYGQQALYGEYDYRQNWLVEGLCPEYYDGSIPGYYESLGKAEAELKAAVFNGISVWDSGFSFTVGYGLNNDPASIAFTMIRDFFVRLSTYDGRNGPSFTVNVQAIPMTLRDFRNRLRPICVIGWLVDFADADDFARPYMWSGIFGFAPDQGYTAENGWGSLKDVLVDQAVLTADGSARATIYQKLQQIYYDDVPSFPLPTLRVRRWQQYWVKGWYYNPMYHSSTYFYSVWKSDDCWFDMSGPTPGVSDGFVNMRDIAYLIAHFGAKSPIPSLPTWLKWVGVYGANGCVDPYGDRVCDMRDIARCILHFNHKINTNTP